MIYDYNDFRGSIHTDISFRLDSSNNNNTDNCILYNFCEKKLTVCCWIYSEGEIYANGLVALLSVLGDGWMHSPCH